MPIILKMYNLPSDVIQLFIKIIIFSTVTCSITQCFLVENSTDVNLVTDSVNNNVYPPNADYNVYKMSAYQPKTDQEKNETVNGVGKLLQKLQRDMKIHGNNVKDDLGNEKFSLLNYMHKFVNNMIRKNEDTEILLTQKERIVNRKKQMGTTETNTSLNETEETEVKKKVNNKLGNIGLERVNSIYRTHSFNKSGNNRDETIIKIPRNTTTPEIDLSSSEEDKIELDVPSAIFTEVEERRKEIPKDDESSHMIDWNKRNIQNQNVTDHIKPYKAISNTNESPNDITTIVTETIDSSTFLEQEESMKNDSLKLARSPNQQEDTSKLEVDWLPNIFSRIFSDFKITSKDGDSYCDSESSFYQAQLKNLSLWAVKMYESSDVIPRGFVVGNGYQMGNFDECVSVKAPSRGWTGRYCLIETHLNFARTRPPLPGQSGSVWNIFQPTDDSDLSDMRFPKDKLYLSMCIPSGCQSGDLEYSLQSALDLQSGMLNESIRFQVHPNLCYAEDQLQRQSRGFMITCSIFGSLSLLVIGVSTYHLITFPLDTERTCSFQMKLLLSFSAVQNLDKLFAKSGEELKFLHGLKFLSMCLIIMGHRLFYYFQGAILDAQNMLQKFVEYDYILVHFNIVDTFFTIGGFLTFYTLYDKVKRHGLKLFPAAILYRWLRLVPVYGAVISFVAIILPSIGNGPIYQLKIAKEALRCEENWWTNLLFVSNYVNTAHSCLIQSWYLSCDFQLFLLGLLILYAISKNESVGIKLLYSCFVISFAIPFLVTWRGRHYGIMRLTTSMLVDPIGSTYFTQFYSKTHNRASCYLLGMITSHLCFKLKEKKVKFTLRQIVLLTIVTYCCMEVTQFYQWLFYVPGRPYYPLENAIYAPLHKVLWSVGVCTIIVVFITTGYGVISPILNHSMYVPLSRLTYCVFLIHSNVQLISIAAARVPEYLTYKTLGWMVGGDIMVSYVLAAVLYVLVEAPVGNLVDMFLKKDKSINS